MNKVADHWDLKRKLNFNHGSFGATPIRILERQAEIEREINRDREGFIWGDCSERLKNAKAVLARFLNADADDLVFTINITESLHTVLKSLPLGAGDEVLMTSHCYPIYPVPIGEWARRQGFKVIFAEMPYPPQSEDEIVEAILAKTSVRTKLAIIDHVSSPTAIVFPIRRIVAALEEKGIDTFVDGAHGPGQVPVDVTEIGAAYYGGNNHKWLCAPVSSGFLHVRHDRQKDVIPAIGSADSSIEFPFTERFVWQGTQSFSARLMVPETIDYMSALHPGGWSGIRKINHTTALAARDMIMDSLGLDKTYPDHMTGTMFTLPLPSLTQKTDLKEIYDMFAERYGFGIYSHDMGGYTLIRVSAHLYNEIADYRILADALNAAFGKHI